MLQKGGHDKKEVAKKQTLKETVSPVAGVLSMVEDLLFLYNLNTNGVLNHWLLALILTIH